MLHVVILPTGKKLIVSLCCLMFHVIYLLIYFVRMHIHTGIHTLCIPVYMYTLGTRIHAHIRTHMSTAYMRVRKYAHTHTPTHARTQKNHREMLVSEQNILTHHCSGSWGCEGRGEESTPTLCIHDVACLSGIVFPNWGWHSSSPAMNTNATPLSIKAVLSWILMGIVWRAELTKCKGKGLKN